MCCGCSLCYFHGLGCFCVLLCCQVHSWAGEDDVGQTLKHMAPQRQHQPAISQHWDSREGSCRDAEQSLYLQVSVSISTSTAWQIRDLTAPCEWLVSTTTACLRLLVLFCRRISGKPCRAPQSSPPVAAWDTAPEASRRHVGCT